MVLNVYTLNIYIYMYVCMYVYALCIYLWPWNQFENFLNIFSWRIPCLESYSPWGHKQSDMTKQLTFWVFLGGSGGKETDRNAGDQGLISVSRCLADYSPWGHKELDTTEQPTFSLFFFAPKLIYLIKFALGFLRNQLTHRSNMLSISVVLDSKQGVGRDRAKVLNMFTI